MADNPGRQFLDIAEDFIRLQNEQDLPSLLRLMHRESFAYKPTQQLLLKIFAAFQLQLTLLDALFITIDNEYAYVRLSLRTEKITGPEFRNNVTEFIVVFKRDGDDWKIWCQHPLGFRVL